MKKETLQNISCFLGGLSLGIIIQCTIPKLLVPNPQSIEDPVVIVSSTNEVEQVQSYTNRPAAKPNVDWFKNGSDYIWDDWKLR